MPVTATSLRRPPCKEWYNRYSECPSAETSPKTIPYVGIIDLRSGGPGPSFAIPIIIPWPKKEYYHQKWSCCPGTLVQDVVDYLIGIYFHSAGGTYVNLFTPSGLHCNRSGVPMKIVQTTGCPLDGSVELRTEVPVPTEFTVFVGIPGWLELSPQITVSGKTFDGAFDPQTFAAIRRWRQKDAIDVSFLLRPRLILVDAQRPETVAVMCGPLALVAVNPPSDMFSRPLPLAHGFKLAQRQGSIFGLETPGQKLRFAPFYGVSDQAYSSYVLSP